MEEIHDIPVPFIVYFSNPRYSRRAAEQKPGFAEKTQFLGLESLH